MYGIFKSIYLDSHQELLFGFLLKVQWRAFIVSVFFLTGILYFKQSWSFKDRILEEKYFFTFTYHSLDTSVDWWCYSSFGKVVFLSNDLFGTTQSLKKCTELFVWNSRLRKIHIWCVAPVLVVMKLRMIMCISIHSSKLYKIKSERSSTFLETIDTCAILRGEKRKKEKKECTTNGIFCQCFSLPQSTLRTGAVFIQQCSKDTQMEVLSQEMLGWLNTFSLWS